MRGGGPPVRGRGRGPPTGPPTGPPRNGGPPGARPRRDTLGRPVGHFLPTSGPPGPNGYCTCNNWSCQGCALGTAERGRRYTTFSSFI